MCSWQWRSLMQSAADDLDGNGWRILPFRKIPTPPITAITLAACVLGDGDGQPCATLVADNLG